MGNYSIASRYAMKTFKEKIQEKCVFPDDAKNKDFKIVAISNQDANNELIMREVRQGLRPKWFCVLRMREPDIPKILHRRKDSLLLEKDIREIKNQLYQSLYGKNWEKKRNRSKSIWGIEYQKNPDNPHINLLIEELPFPYDNYRSTYVLIDRLLPLVCKSISPFRNDSDVQPVSYSEGVAHYISKESDWSNSTILHSVSDFYNHQLELPFTSKIQ